MSRPTAGTCHKATKTRRLLCGTLCLGVFVAHLFAAARPSPVSALQNRKAPPLASNLHQWGAVTLFHGLPSDHVRAITQDSDGMMWFGTDGGLVKYDGRRIQRLATDGPAARRVLSLNLDSDGVLWIGTDAGAARLMNGEIKSITETQDSAVTAIITPEAGRALMTSEQGEIFDCSTARDGSLSVHQIAPGDHPLLTIESRGHVPLRLTSLALIDDTLIVGTRSRGLLAIDATQMKAGATRTPDLVKEILSRPRTFFVEAIETDARGRLWFGAETSAEDSGFYDSVDLMRPQKIGAGMGAVTALKADARGNIWVGTDARGAFVYRDGRKTDQFTFESTGGGLLSNHIYSIFIDREGVAWFGTDRGVCRYDPHALHVEAISSDADGNFARALFEASDGTLLCGSNKGLFIRTGNASWMEVPELRGRVVHSIAEDSQGRILVGTASGLFAGPKSPSKRPRDGAIHSAGWRQFSRVESAAGTTDNIRAIDTFQGATYVANFGSGVERLDGSTRTLVWPEASADPRWRQVVSLHADKKHSLCIGTAEAGLFFFDGKQVKIDHALDELIGSSVWSIDGGGDDRLWMATARGLYSLKSGILSRVIDGIDARSVFAGANGAAWCATVGGGLYRAVLSDDETVLTSRVDIEQGLPSQSVFSVIQARAPKNDPTIWIGTSRGVARYEPCTTPPLLAVTRAMGKRAYSIEELRPGLNLEYPQNSLSLDVAAVSSRTFPEQFQYAFTVSDEAGRTVSKKLSGESQLLIENLRPGRYRVQAQAFSRDLVPSDVLRLELAVASAPFPWTSTALSFLLALALVAIWWGFRQNKRLVGANQQLVETRTQLASETESERRRIARDLHDQTLSDLRRLMLLTDQLPASESNNGHARPSKIREEIEAVSTEIRRICEDLSPSALANVGLGAALEWALADAVAHQPPEKMFEYEFVCDGGIEERLKLTPADQIQIYRIAQEAVSNICRHSGATWVKLAVGIDVSGELLIKVEDNGCGFDASKLAKMGRGLTNIRSRASLIEASVSWSARRGGGTEFTLRKTVAGFVAFP